MHSRITKLNCSSESTVFFRFTSCLNLTSFKCPNHLCLLRIFSFTCRKTLLSILLFFRLYDLLFPLVRLNGWCTRLRECLKSERSNRNELNSRRETPNLEHLKTKHFIVAGSSPLCYSIRRRKKYQAEFV